LDLGKARARAMVESFGGKVTSSVSGKTHVLLAGPASQCTAAHHVIHQRERETLPRV
jgi:NAD-dependent DNA ligase